MNRRELFKGAIAALAAASIPIPDELVVYGRSPFMDALPDMRVWQYLKKVQLDLAHKIANPPVVLDGHRIRPVSTQVQEEAYRYISLLLEDPSARPQEIEKQWRDTISILAKRG